MLYIWGINDDIMRQTSLKIFHYLINNAFNWMCVGSVTYSLVILLKHKHTHFHPFFFAIFVYLGVTHTQNLSLGCCSVFVPLQT